MSRRKEKAMTDKVYEFLTAPRRTRIRIKSIEAQLAEMIEAAKAPPAIRCDRDRVQASPDPDPLAGLMARCDEMASEIIRLKRQEVRQCDAIREKCRHLNSELEYAVICMNYIGMIPVEEIAKELNYSIPSTYRIRRKAQNRLDDIISGAELKR